jgi:hypothetical protein
VRREKKEERDEEERRREKKRDKRWGGSLPPPRRLSPSRTNYCSSPLSRGLALNRSLLCSADPRVEPELRE